MVVIYLLVAMLGAAAAFFALQNPEPVTVTFLQWRSATLPLSMLVLFSALAGVLLTALSGVAQQVRMNRRIHYLERRLADIADVPRQPTPVRVEVVPERVVSERSAAERIPERVVSERTASERIVPERVVSERTAAERVAPDRMASERVVSERTTSERMAPKRMEYPLPRI